MSWTKSWETQDGDDNDRQKPRRGERQADDVDKRRRVCPDCAGSALSPYDDGGSCPHCFGGYVN